MDVGISDTPSLVVGCPQGQVWWRQPSLPPTQKPNALWARDVGEVEPGFGAGAYVTHLEAWVRVVPMLRTVTPFATCLINRRARYVGDGGSARNAAVVDMKNGDCDTDRSASQTGFKLFSTRTAAVFSHRKWCTAKRLIFTTVSISISDIFETDSVLWSPGANEYHEYVGGAATARNSASCTFPKGLSPLALRTPQTLRHAQLISVSRTPVPGEWRSSFFCLAPGGCRSGMKRDM